MNEIVLIAAQFAIKYGIPAAQHLVELYHKPDPSIEDFKKLFELSTENAKKFLQLTEGAERNESGQGS